MLMIFYTCKSHCVLRINLKVPGCHMSFDRIILVCMWREFTVF